MNLRLLIAALLVLHSALAAAESGGKLVSTGSDTLGALSALWAQGVMEAVPDVTVQVRAVGSSAAPIALIEGTAEIGPMSRPMTGTELERFRARYGYAPTAVPVAVDTLAVFVHRDNPLRSLTQRELDGIFSANHRCGGAPDSRRWRDLGITAPWGSRVISAYGRDAASGTYGFFRRELLCGGDYGVWVNRLVGSAAVVRAVGADVSAIGYASSGFLSDGVRKLRVVLEDGSDINLSRDLLLYLNLEPNSMPRGLLRSYLRYALSAEGQALVRAAGYTPLTAERRVALQRTLLLESKP